MEALEMMLEEKYTWARWSVTDTDKSYWGIAGAGDEAGHADGGPFMSGAASSEPGVDLELVPGVVSGAVFGVYIG
eukprot:gene8664-8845_t